MSNITVGLKNLKVVCFIGILEREKRKKQPLFIDVSCSFTITNMKDTLDYSILKNLCESMALSKKYDLLEELAYDLCKEIKKIRPMSIRICLKKPKAFSNVKYAYASLEDIQ